MWDMHATSQKKPSKLNESVNYKPPFRVNGWRRLSNRYGTTSGHDRALVAWILCYSYAGEEHRRESKELLVGMHYKLSLGGAGRGDEAN